MKKMGMKTCNSGLRRHTKAASSPSRISCEYLSEPFLAFADEQLHVDPKAGIARYGPRSYGKGDHPERVRVGLIGTPESIAITRSWLEVNAEGVPGDEKNREFPGYRRDRGFCSELAFDDAGNETVTQTELEDLLRPRRSQKDRFTATVGLLDEKLRLLGDRDHPPQYVVIGLPEHLVRRCRIVEYHDADLGMVHRDLRRAIKATAMKYRIPTQLLRQQTMEGRDPTPPAKIAWNFFTGLYFKAGGSPWGPHGLGAGTCYAGISFYRPLGSKRLKMQTSLVQAFDEHGEGLVLRGPGFEWDAEKEGTASPHLTEQQAAELMELVLTRYQRERRQMPRRVVIHKTSRYWPPEREGLTSVLRGRVAEYDLLALSPQSAVRLITLSKYPPLRCTRFTVGDLDYLYTTGFIAALNEFHAMHVPSPLQIADHVGQDTPRQTLLSEVLALTKMNWNSAQFGSLFPITLRFSRLVGDIMREIPQDGNPLPQFKYYM
jgi:hypothetical protein